MGFSAGGHLAATASTRFDSGKPNASDDVDRASSRPDFSVLCYPVISLTEAWTHQGSKLNLLRWVNARTIKETFVPASEHHYPFMDAE